MTELPFELETDLERTIAGDPAWIEGIQYGRPRPGHPEGQVMFHIADVLKNIDRHHGDSPLRERLRLIALVHDSFKYQVDPSRPKVGENHHGHLARRFAERFVDDPAVLTVIELHDEAYNSWRQGSHGDWPKAEQRAGKLLERLGDVRQLYLGFHRCDNETGDKSREPYEWFEQLCGSPRPEEGPSS